MSYGAACATGSARPNTVIKRWPAGYRSTVMRKMEDSGMTRLRAQLEETYALVGRDPAAWVEQAQGMRIAADPILESLLHIVDVPQNQPGIRLKKLAYVRAYMLLMGYSFENLLKAIAASRGLLATDPDMRFDTSFKREKGDHGLTAAARSLDLEMSPSEEAYLRRLEEYLYWAGRYPISRRRGTYVDGHSERHLTFISSDPELGGALFDRFAEVVANSA